ncbi:MAG: nicotinate-nucleotide adenylyltransferase [Clostridia bacterium]|nr:nicotinate-nucleotide adenylyltransferase [Clostridia bacterium]
MKLGIMGGTFNPIHNGHLAIARMAADELGLDEVLFLPDGEPPHKPAGELASGVSRFNMTALAVWGHAGFSVSDMEILRGGTTYTIDTLTEIGKIRPGASLFYIVGADALFTVGRWKDTERIAKLCQLAAAARPGQDIRSVKAQAEILERAHGYTVRLLSGPGPDVSSTEIRRRASSGESGATPREVADYIAQHGLYGAPLHPMTLRLKQTLSPHRLSHTLSVAETAVRLAARFGENPCQAHLAGMLHDCAKGLDAPALLRLIRAGGVPADELELSMPALLHAPAGAVLAREEYRVGDEAVLSAIRWHTTGRRNMTKLEKIIYLADMIEPEREDFPGLSEIRALALKDLDRAVSLAAARSAAYVAEQGRTLHPNTMELAREYHD